MNLKDKIEKITKTIGDEKPELKVKKSVKLLEDILKQLKKDNSIIDDLENFVNKLSDVANNLVDSNSGLSIEIDKLNELTIVIEKVCELLSSFVYENDNKDILSQINTTIKKIPITEKVEVSNLKEYPNDIKINNLNEIVEKLEILTKKIEESKPVEKKFPDSFEINNLPKQIDKVEIKSPIELKKPKWYKSLDLIKIIKGFKEDIEKVGNSLLDSLLKKRIQANIDKYQNNKEAIAVKLVDSKGKIIENFLKGFKMPSTLGGGNGIGIRQLQNKNKKTINPATEDKQDDIITQLKTDFFLEVTKGTIVDNLASPYFFHSKFLNETKKTVWDVNANITLQTSAQIVELVSTSANDNILGTGATIVLIEGVDNNFNAINEVISPTGIVPVTLTKTYLRIDRMTVGLHGDPSGIGKNDGDITAQVSGGGDIMCRILADNSISRGPTFTIPAGKEGHMTDFIFMGGKNSDIEMFIVLISSTGVKINLIPFEIYENNPNLSMRMPLKFPEKTTIIFEATSTSINGKISAALNLDFVDK